MSVVCFGNFDGVHIGHVAILNKCIELGKTHNIESKALLLTPVTKVYHSGFKEVPINASRIKDIYDKGVDYVCAYIYSGPFAKLDAVSFVSDILVRQHKATHIVSGPDAMFGYARRGNVQLLEKLSSELGYVYHKVEFITDTGKVKVSSTNIRGMLRKGLVKNVSYSIGKAYTNAGRSVQGIGYCASINMPTANIVFNNSIMPGVYAGHCHNTTKNLEANALIYVDNSKSVEVHMINDNPNGFICNMWGDRFSFSIVELIRAKIEIKNIYTQDTKKQYFDDLTKVKAYFS